MCLLFQSLEIKSLELQKTFSASQVFNQISCNKSFVKAKKNFHVFFLGFFSWVTYFEPICMFGKPINELKR